MRKLENVLKNDKYNKFNNSSNIIKSKTKINLNEETNTKKLNSLRNDKTKIKNVYEDFNLSLFNNFM